MARPNAAAKWEVTQVPQLRIVDDALWSRVKARQREVRIEISRDAAGNALNRAHRRLLSGLLRCERLAEALNEPQTASEAGEILRALIERVVLTPTDLSPKSHPGMSRVRSSSEPVGLGGATGRGA